MEYHPQVLPFQIQQLSTWHTVGTQYGKARWYRSTAADRIAQSWLLGVHASLQGEKQMGPSPCPRWPAQFTRE